MVESAETRSPQLLIIEYNNSIVSYDDVSIDQFFVLSFFTQHVITHISSRVPLNCIAIDQINKLPQDGLKSSPETSRYIANTWISQKIKIKLYFPCQFSAVE